VNFASALAELAVKLIVMTNPSQALINIYELSPATRKELEVWGQHLAHTSISGMPKGHSAKSEKVLAELQRTAALKAYLVSEADKAIKEAVYRARKEKMSWHTIGNALGVTGEAARLRYSDR
jgi:helix-turn-helix protein